MDTRIEWPGGSARVEVQLRDGILLSERFVWRGVECGMDGDFLLDFVWSDWRAPGKDNNGENECRLDKSDFRFVSRLVRGEGRSREWVLSFHGPDVAGFYRPSAPLELDLVYRMDEARGYFRRRLELRDPNANGHLLSQLSSYNTLLDNAPSVVKAGGFGQPAAWLMGGNGAFFGVEWPAAAISLDGRKLSCRQEMGELLGAQSLRGEWAILGLTEDSCVKQRFFEYVDTIRAAPLRPYTLYNTWYDLRTAEYQKRLPSIQDSQIMDEENVSRLVSDVQENMCAKHGIELDAFVLDDGWDVYESAWELRPKEFPHGLKPIAEKLAKTSTRLGIWFGPTGGYSFRKTRTDWFRANGYEVSSNDMMAISGPRYAALFEERVRQMVGAGSLYFKWDGFQFVCNEGFPGVKSGIYARRQGLKNLQRVADAARGLNSDTYLNITSGTWLSPWWLMIADQIWMDGNDFGSAELSSVSTRDSSITYRDLVLNEDFKLKDLWFPLSSLMTHGVLKGTIDVGDIGRNEPLSKFADEMMFYLARGVSMYELYLSPKELRDDEWRVLAASLRWARDRFPLLSAPAHMIGGDIQRGDAYGYAHWKGSRGIVGLRNPGMERRSCRLELDPAQGLDPDARDLVIRRVYPTRWTSPRLYKPGEGMDVSLAGYEAAVYEIAPLSDFSGEALAGLVYDEGEGGLVFPVRNDGNLAILSSAGARRPGSELSAISSIPTLQNDSVVINYSHTRIGEKLDLSLELRENVSEPQVALLLKPGIKPPAVKSGLAMSKPAIRSKGGADLIVDAVTDERGLWTWYSARLPVGTEALELDIDLGPLGQWNGDLGLWALGDVKSGVPPMQAPHPSLSEARPMPPLARAPGSDPARQELASLRWGARNATV